MSNVSPINPANLDQYQMDNMSFDVKKGAWRVTMVDGITLNVDNIQIDGSQIGKQTEIIKIPEIIRENSVQTIEIPQVIKQTEYINVPVIVKEFEKVEIPVIIKEIEYKTIEVPVLIPEIKYIETPIVIKQVEFKELPIYIKVCIVIQTLASIGYVLTHLK